MLIKTKCFGEVDIAEDKIITFENGLFGFEEYKKYTVLYDVECKEESISWLQSIDEPTLALPVVSPLLVKPDYNPVVEDTLLESLGTVSDENMAIFFVMTVPSDLTLMSVNLKAPLLINADSKKGIQIIVENQDYPVKYMVYDLFTVDNRGGN